MNSCQNSSSKEFHLLAFTALGTWKAAIFSAFLLMYMLAITGNLIIAALICKVPQLHTPMYFFLCNLSIVETLFVSAILPKLLAITATGDKGISFELCVTQIYFTTFGASGEFLFLTCMAYDRYVAICIPLRYLVVMRKGVCALLIAWSWIFSICNGLILTLPQITLSFCFFRDINNCFCEIRSVLAISSSDTTGREVVVLLENIFLVFLTFVLIVTSYVYIISSVLKIHSKGGRYKTFSSCSSHLTSVLLFYGPLFFLYMRPKSKYSTEQGKLLSLLYMVVVPTLNPFVYTMRNKEAKGAIGRLVRSKWSKH
ncbi:olfactory receptor-like protein OLF3 [Gastrophryne carolinensis]